MTSAPDALLIEVAAAIPPPELDAGEVPLPTPGALPSRLAAVEYEPVD